MDSLKEQRIAVKFCVKLGKSATETFVILNTVYGDVATKRHERFEGIRQSIDDDERRGRPSTSTDYPQLDKINTLVYANQLLTIRELTEECGISVFSVADIFIC